MIIITIVSWVLYIYSILLVINAILSWVPVLAQSFVGRLIGAVVEPYLNLFRQGPFLKLMYATGIDISPIIGLFILYLIRYLVLSVLIKLLLGI